MSALALSVNESELVLSNDITQFRKNVISSNALHYKYAPLIERVSRKLDLTLAESESLCSALMEFLSLAAFNKSPHLKQLNPPHMIDAAWHEALLFTREYHALCDRFFGQFIHHTPFTEYEKMIRRVQHQQRFTAVDDTISLAIAVYGNLSKWWTSPNMEGVNQGDCESSVTCGGDNNIH
jgi:hypothetical protein